MKTGNSKASIIYMSHGGGPLPIIGDPSHSAMVDFLGGVTQKMPQPDEILVISAHWEEPVPTVYSEENQHLLFDYYGFPEKTYRLKYPTLCNSDLADALLENLKAGLGDTALNTSRGIDHGVFIPLMLMYPDGGIPVTQLSLVRGLDPQTHIRMGEALRPLLARNIMIIGSGFSFHNMQHFNMRSDIRDEANDAFQDWLIETCTGISDGAEVNERLAEWKSAPNARYCHPREEHLLPLHVCAGAGGSGAELIFDDYIAGKRSVALRWQ